MRICFAIILLFLISESLLFSQCKQYQPIEVFQIQSNKNATQQQLLKALLKVERKIQKSLSRRVQQQGLAFILNQIMSNTISLTIESQKNTKENIKIYPVPSISYKSRSDSLFSIFLTDGNVYTTVDNEIVLNHHHFSNKHLSKILYFGVRNEISLFANIQLSKNQSNQRKTNITILKTSFQNKKLNLEVQISFQSVRNSSEYIDFIYTQAMNKRFYIFSTATGELDFYLSSTGQMEYKRKVSKNQAPLYVQKLGNNILAYSIQQIYAIHSVTKNLKVDVCQLPFEKIIDIDIDDFHMKNFIVKTKDKIYNYQGFPHCKPTYSYKIPDNSSIFLVKDNIFVFIEGAEFYYYINRTDHKVQNYNIPSTKCQKQTNFSTLQQSFYISKKNHDYFVLCHFCISQRQYEHQELQIKDKVKRQMKLNAEYLSIEFENQYQEDTDYSQLRVPLIICSFIFVIYLSVKRNRSSPQETQKKKQKQQMMKRQCQMLIQKLKNQNFRSSQNQDKQEKDDSNQPTNVRVMTKQENNKTQNQKQSKQKEKSL